MNASIVTIGDEILIGQIVDTNSQYLAKQLDALGFNIVSMTSISDQEDAILACLSDCLHKMDLVVLTGGLGPTKDDVTKRVFCDFFEDTLILDDQVHQHVEQMLVRLFGTPLLAINKAQALVPSRAKVLFNEGGTAPGLLMQKDNTTYVVLPGVPFEMKNIFEQELKPFLVSSFKNEFRLHQTIVTRGIGESVLSELLSEWELGLGSVKLAYLPSFDQVRLRLTVVDEIKLEAEKKVEKCIRALPATVLPYIISFSDEDILDIVIKNLIYSGKSISFAESCTGGKFAAMFSERPGASNYFKGGMVTYATESKINILGVNRATIEKHSVVSAEVAIEMAVRAREQFGSDYAIASTGNAGPSKGDSDVELGTVFLALATENDVLVEKFNFGQPREKVINSALAKGLKLIYNQILKK